MDYKKFVGYGIAIYVIAFMVASAVIMLKIEGAIFSKLLTPALVGIAAFLFARQLPVKNCKDPFWYGLAWVLIAAILDVLVAVPFAGWELFSQWNVWLGYSLIFIAPFLAHKFSPGK